MLQLHKIAGVLSCGLLCFPVYGENTEQAENEVFFDVGVALIGNDWLVTPANTHVDDRFIPAISVGVGRQYALDQAWLFESRLSIEHARTDNFRFSPIVDAQSAELENTGLWLDSTFKYTAWSDDVRPFVTLGAGKVYGQYTDATTEISGWETGVRAFAGLEFDISPDFSFSIALGTVDNGDLD